MEEEEIPLMYPLIKHTEQIEMYIKIHNNLLFGDFVIQFTCGCYYGPDGLMTFFCTACNVCTVSGSPPNVTIDSEHEVSLPFTRIHVLF
jgi:hypothetical protein